ncbi:MAG: 16S rRNA (cytosine(967)-C(5))-methyltransferase RsmB [Gammaproteobacteria bacterium]|nr:16S rRNA (cytosine(967)-C(5))-methyltransferase RsmB [Gammaproteobacteria bacterium]
MGALSARVLMKVFRGATLESALARYRNTDVYPKISHICYESMRHYFSISERLQTIVDRPTSRLDLEVWCVLLVAAAQIEHSRTPTHAAVSMAVDATRKLGKSSASGLVNASLRRYRQEEKLDSREAIHELPDWLIDHIELHYFDERLSLIDALNSRAPLTVRVNSSKISVGAFCNALEIAGISFCRPDIANAVIVDRSRSMTSLPGFQEGFFVVQDLSSQMAVPLLNPQPGDRILDGCAAPGIKTSQIHDLYPECKVDSFDIKEQCSTWNNASNSQLNWGFEIRNGDLRNTDWWDGTPYQRILLDVPCSGTGTIRRHPDIKATRTLDQISELVDLQLQLLTSTWKALAPAGRLVYCTCSLLPEENDAVINQFIEENPDAQVESVQLVQGLSTSFGQQILPAIDGGDGFYFSCLHKSEK